MWLSDPVPQPSTGDWDILGAGVDISPPEPSRQSRTWTAGAPVVCPPDRLGTTTGANIQQHREWVDSRSLTDREHFMKEIRFALRHCLVSNLDLTVGWSQSIERCGLRSQVPW